MHSMFKSIIMLPALCVCLLAVCPAFAGNDGKGDKNKNCQMDPRKCEDYAKQDEECSAYLKKQAAECEDKAKQASGEEATLLHKLSQNFTDGSAAKEKLAQAKRDRNLEAAKAAEQACQKLIQENGRLTQQLQKIKGGDPKCQKGGDLAKADEKQKAAKDNGGTTSIESDADMKRWLNEDGSSKK